MANAPTNTTPADEAFALFCEQGAAALDMAAALGIDLLAARRVHTGYMPEQQRRAVAHRTYRDGLRTPSRRPTAAERARTEAQKWGMAS